MALESNEVHPEFQLNLLFERSKNPIIAFTQLGNVLSVLNEFDKGLLENLNLPISIDYSLEDIEFSSIKTLIAQILRAVPDEAIKTLDLKALIGAYLLKSKYYLLKKLENNERFDSKELLTELKAQIDTSSQTIKEKVPEGLSTEINIYVLLNTISDLSKVVTNFRNDDAIEYVSKEGTAKLTNAFVFNKSKILLELGSEEIVNETTEVLKIKKIDLLSDEAKWELKRGTQTLSVKILDAAFLEAFHERKFALIPNDSLRVRMRTTYHYNPTGDSTEPIFEITEVFKVIPPLANSGNSLF